MVRVPSGWVYPGVVAAALLAFAAPVRAGSNASLAKARHDLESSDYLGARGALSAALEAGTCGPAELAEAYRMSGIVDAALGDDAKATDAFARWIALDPKAQLPAGTSPKITQPFQAAAVQVGHGSPLDVKVETSAAPPSVTLVIARDTLHLIERARVKVSVDGGPEQILEGAGDGRITIALPHGKRLDLRVQAIDAHGNRVVELGSKQAPIAITAAVVPHGQPHGAGAAHPAHARPLWARWWMWGGASVVVFAGASYFGLDARHQVDRLDALDADSQNHTFDEARQVESTARRDVIVFDAGAIAAGTLALGAAILYLTRPHAPQLETRVGAVPVRGGGALVIGGRF